MKRRYEDEPEVLPGLEGTKPFTYVNLEAVNNTPEPILFDNSVNVGDILGSHPKEYFVAVARLVLSGTTIPILLLDPNKYKVTVFWNNAPHTVSLVYVPHDKRYGLNTIFSYVEFSRAITIALGAAHDLAVIAGMPNVNLTPPLFTYTDATNLYTLSHPTEYITNGASIRFNTALYTLFNNFYHNKLAVVDQEYEIIAPTWDPVTKNPLNGGVNPLVLENYIIITQEYEALFNMQEFTTIVLRSNKLGTRPEYLPNANTTDSLNSGDTSSGYFPSSNILTDLIPYIGGDSAGVRGTQYYTPTIYRWINLITTQIKDIDLTVSIRDKVGREYPYYIPAFTTAKIKLVFCHRDNLY